MTNFFLLLILGIVVLINLVLISDPLAVYKPQTTNLVLILYIVVLVWILLAI